MFGDSKTLNILSTVDNKIIDKSIKSLDHPYSDPSVIPSFMLSEEISKYFKVAISGDGGDELLGGYKRLNLTLSNKNFETFTGKWFKYDCIGFKKKLLIYFSVRVPRKVFKFIFGEMHSILFSSQKVSSKKIENSGYNFKHSNFDNAIVNLDK